MNDALECPECRGRMEYHERCMMDDTQHFFCLTADCGTYVSPGALVSRLKAYEGAVRGLLIEIGDCTCHESYRMRPRLVDPECFYHRVDAEVDALRALSPSTEAPAEPTEGQR